LIHVDGKSIYTLVIGQFFTHTDYILIPSPYYGGFDIDICLRSGVKIYPVDCTSDNNYMPTMKLLEDTLAKARNEVLTISSILQNFLFLRPDRFINFVYKMFSDYKKIMCLIT